ncbi:hypothetical protein KY290_037041 [Solanum tuberosum]|uniref:Ulp1 protease family, C-terminal catalytic domain containing protein n=1 Tax=Solanum tuberosum TaxID=4113 RepID=A0ABQ7TUV8_SOLTU|nr:hypothetical protein KY290_037041 [Solanum tuberosum]
MGGWDNTDDALQMAILYFIHTFVFSQLGKSTNPTNMYRLNEFPYALNIWVYECASVIHNKIVVKEENGIPRICNWKVVAPKPKFEMFMETIFTEPTLEEIKSLDLPNNSHIPPTHPATSDVNHEEVQPDEVPGFEDFSSKLPEQLLRRSTRVSST